MALTGQCFYRDTPASQTLSGLCCLKASCSCVQEGFKGIRRNQALVFDRKNRIKTRGKAPHMSKSPQESKTLVLWPESPDELLRALESWARLRSANPSTEIELVLFCRTVSRSDAEKVLNSERSFKAGEVLLARYLDAFD